MKGDFFMNDKMKALWDKICAGATAAGEFAAKTAESAGEKAKGVYNTSKISLKIFDLTTDIEVLYKEVGRLVYAAHSGGKMLPEDLDERLAAIDEINAQIEELRAQQKNEAAGKKCSECGKVCDAGDAFCSACGTKFDD